MGWGDELIAAGQARRMRRSDPRKVRVYDRRGQARSHEAWRHSPSIALPHETGDCQRLVNSSGERPYIAGKQQDRWIWKPFTCEPGELRFDTEEAAFAARHAVAGAIVIESQVKRKASPNKDWGAARWLKFAQLAREVGIALVQLGAQRPELLPGAVWVETWNMRLACAVLGTAAGYVGHEGGLHHAAAALGKPAVVLFGGFISPAQTGYATHRNLFTANEACGMRIPCRHCAKAMARIEPEQVLHETLGMLNA